MNWKFGCCCRVALRVICGGTLRVLASWLMKFVDLVLWYLKWRMILCNMDLRGSRLYWMNMHRWVLSVSCLLEYWLRRSWMVMVNFSLNSFILVFRGDGCVWVEFD